MGCFCRCEEFGFGVKREGMPADVTATDSCLEGCQVRGIGAVQLGR